MESRFHMVREVVDLAVFVAVAGLNDRRARREFDEWRDAIRTKRVEADDATGPTPLWPALTPAPRKTGTRRHA